MRPRTPSRRRRLRAAALILAAALLAAGCAVLPEPRPTPDAAAGPEADSAEALALLEAIRKANEPLKTFKGIGRLTIRKEGKLQLDGRMAWVGADPRRLSVVLSAAGFPAVRLASDGESLYYQDPQDPGGSVKRIRTSDPDLERLLGVPITAGDIVTLLCGRIPLKEYRSVKLLEPPGEDGRVLVLSRIWGVQQKIFLDRRLETVRATAVYDSAGALVYQAHFMEIQRVGAYRVPQRLALLNGDKAEIQLVVENYWADVPVSPAMFVLPPPG